MELGLGRVVSKDREKKKENKKGKEKRVISSFYMSKFGRRVPRDNLPQIRGPILSFFKARGNFYNSV